MAEWTKTAANTLTTSRFAVNFTSFSSYTWCKTGQCLVCQLDFHIESKMKNEPFSHTYCVLHGLEAVFVNSCVLNMLYICYVLRLKYFLLSKKKLEAQTGL